ncbi:MAG: NifU family protein [Pseudomonadota bacterium]
MFIQTETTPNPATLKFLPGRVVMDMGTADFRSAEEAGEKSPLAARLFEVDGVEGVFFGYDFITITKDEAVDWSHMKPAILAGVMEHFTANLPVMDTESGAAIDEEGEEFFDSGDENIVTTIKELIETRVRPAVAQDGGDITFRGYKEGVVFLHMKGACAGCPSSTATLKHGIQNLLRHFIPEVQQVEAI